MSIEVDKLGETEYLDPVTKETAADQRVINTALQALKIHSVDVKPIDLITQRQGILWRCIGLTINPLGGKIFHYKLREEYDAQTYPYKAKKCQSAIHQKQQQIFPAVEPSSAEDIAFSQELQKIGYGVRSDETGVYLNLPDLEAIVAGYEKLRETRPDLPPLRALSSEGIADDLSFSRAYLHYDILLSDGIEFIHDSISHTSRVLEMMISSPAEYVKSKGQVAKSTKHTLEAIHHSQLSETEQLYALTFLGAVIDTIWAAPAIRDLIEISQEEFNENILDIWKDPDYKFYWKKIHATPIDLSQAATIWSAIASF